MSGKQWRKFHAAATLVWVALAVPTMIAWRESIAWVAFMSVWANIVGHWSSFQAARSEERSEPDA